MKAAILLFMAMRALQFAEGGLEEEQSKALVLSEVVTDLANHYDAVWIAASRDLRHPLVIVGVDENPKRWRDRQPIDSFAMDWIGLWNKRFGDDLTIEIVDFRSPERKQWQSLADKQFEILKPIEWMEAVFFSEDPFEDNAGLEELRVLQEAA